MKIRFPATLGLLLIVAVPCRPQSQYDDGRLYRFMIRQNKAQVVMLAEEGLSRAE